MDPSPAPPAIQGRVRQLQRASQVAQPPFVDAEHLAAGHRIVIRTAQAPSRKELADQGSRE